jgi:hypothetical protein
LTPTKPVLAASSQERWLGLFGRSLASEFQIDAMTLLVRTKCFHLWHDAIRLNCARAALSALVPAKAGTQYWIPASAGMSGEWDDSI